MDYGDVQLVTSMIEGRVASALVPPAVDYDSIRAIVREEIALFLAEIDATREAERIEAERIAAEAASVEAALETVDNVAETVGEIAEQVGEIAAEVEDLTEDSEEERDAEIADAVDDAAEEGEELPPEVAEILNEESGEPQEPQRGGFWNRPILRAP